MDTKIIYNNARSGYKALSQGRMSGAVHNFTKLYKEGVENPAQTKLLIQAGKQQAKKEALKGIMDDEFIPVVPFFKMYYSNAKIRLNKAFRNAKEQFESVYKEIYPKTHKLRDKLISSGKVKSSNM